MTGLEFLRPMFTLHDSDPKLVVVNFSIEAAALRAR